MEYREPNDQFCLNCQDATTWVMSHYDFADDEEGFYEAGEFAAQKLMETTIAYEREMTDTDFEAIQWQTLGEIAHDAQDDTLEAERASWTPETRAEVDAIVKEFAKIIAGEATDEELKALATLLQSPKDGGQ